MELASDETYKSYRRSKWQSISALTEHDPTHSSSQQPAVNLDRLKKSYATMRKSFRLQLSDRKRRFNFSGANSSNDLSATDGDNKTKSGNLIGHIGSSAVKLLRGVYSKGQHSGNINQFELDSVDQLTKGSFKVLSSSHYGDATVKKSSAEHEIEQRLRRSRRRILPSAQYQAPDCEHACDDLDLDELEAIKRDNLRLTLRSIKVEQPKNLSSEVNHRGDIEKIVSDDQRDQNLCICKSIELHEENRYQHHHQQQLYCSCLSLESSGAVVNNSFKDRSESSWSAAILVDNREDDNESLTVNEEEAQIVSEEDVRQDDPRASGGFEGQQFEDELGEMLVGLLRERMSARLDANTETTISNDKDNFTRMLENVCGERQEDSGGGELISTPPSAHCVHLSLTERENEIEAARSSEFRVIDGLSELQQQTEQFAEGSKVKNQRGMNDDERMQSARNCCKLGGVSSLSEGVIQQRQQQRQASQAAADGVQNNEQQKPKSSSSNTGRTTGNNHGRFNKPNSFSCAKDETIAATTLTCCGTDGVKVRALSVATKTGYGDGQRKKAGSCSSRKERDAVCEPSEVIQISEKQNTDERREKREDMNERILWPPRGYNLSSDTNTMQRGKRDKYHLPIGFDQPEEHLYASIHCASSPSPERFNADHNHHHHHHNYLYTGDDGIYHDQSAQWQQPYNDNTLIGMNMRNLFDKQLNNNYKFESTCKDPMKKKSIFGRIKQLIVPVNSKANNGDSKVNRIQDGKSPHYSWDYEIYHMPHGGLQPRHKSATLSSKSTQNLLASSMRYLSTSRKSINHIIESDDDENLPGATRRSFINGFLTLGRSNKHSLNKHQSVSQLFTNNSEIQRSRSHSVAASKRRTFGSTDSLHSADSGLSCSNLQNSSSSDENNYMAIRASDNLYSGGPNSNERVEQSPEITSRMVVVGKAVAKVDCNPCAYDKEALVFKRDDIIDILERDQSGSWIGQCNGQIGHFKFINVTEIPIDESENNGTTDDEDEASNVNDDKAIETDNNSEKKEGVFITKLVIKGNNNNNPSLSTSDRGNNQPTSLTDSRIRSLSMDTIDLSTAHTMAASTSSTKSGRQTFSNELVRGNGGKASSGDNCLSNSNETIMSSLEQLLFAIGLAGEKVTTNYREINGQAAQRPTSLTTIADNNQQKSAEERNEESDRGQEANKRQQQQIAHLSYLNVLNEHGINSLDSFSAIDDWHELVQFGIINDEHQRRLLMAARIIRQASQAARLDFVQNRRAKPDNQRLPVKEVASVDGGNETNPAVPTATANTTSQIITDKARSQSRLVETKAKCMGAPDEPVYVNLVSAGNGSICPAEPSTITSSEQQLNTRDHGILAGGGTGHSQCLGQRRSAHPSEMSPVHSKQIMGFTGKIVPNPINQSDHDHYHRTRRRPSSPQGHRQSLVAVQGNYIDYEQSRLVRGYSIRPDIGRSMVQKFNGQTNNFRCRTRQYSGNNNYQISGLVDYQSPMTATVVSQQTNRATNGRRVGTKTAHSRELKCQPSPIVPNSQRSQMMIVNSKSAYDLRFDLSHFFT